MIRLLQILWKQITFWLWPEVCPFCGKVSQQGICTACRGKLENLRIQEPRCVQCGKPIRYAEQEYCHDCMHTSHSYDRGLSLWLHKAPVSTSVYQFKYHNQRRYGAYYAEEMARYYSRTIKRWNPDLIIPVPLHRKRRKKRGYNQAQIVGKELGKILQIPVDCRSLIRSVYTEPQKTLDHAQRRKNLRHAFSVREGFVPVPAVLLIDDIYTTGNTIDNAAKTLKESGVEKVYFLTISIGQGY